MNPPVVLVTGAARRIGAEIARTLHAAGANIVLHHRRYAAAAEVVAGELNALRKKSALVVRRDLLDVAGLASMVEETVTHFGRLDVLVNNASSFFSTEIGSIDETVWEDLVGSNLKGPLFLSQAAAPHLLKTHGCIVNITDIHAEWPLRGYPLYCAAKAGLFGLTKALALELGPQVRVNAVAPGAVAWPENEDDFPPSERQAIIAHTLLKRIGTPADIARTVKFLVFDAPYITGQIINVDGGRTAHL